MISVENFYWILSQVLLKPRAISCRYFYPFGTTDHLSCHEFQLENYTKFGTLDEHHVLFHFDQEPIYPESDGHIFNGTKTNYFKAARILANSEKSVLKKHFCKKYQLLDWYYFYHGFAALNWYRDAMYLDHEPGWSNPFISLNHLVRNKRSYRMALTARLIERRLIDSGLVSFHGTAQDCQNELKDPYSALSAADKKLVEKNLCSGNPQRVIDTDRVTATWSARMGYHEYGLRQKGLWHLVNETVFYDDKLHLTEKIFQPVVTERPFILVAAPGSLAYFKSYGFHTFGDWIDESYDTILDPCKRLDAITDQVQNIVAQPRSVLDSMFRDMKPVLEHNKRHFFTDFKRLIVNELVENLDTCVRIWNNGRVDDRMIMPCSNLDLVRSILMR